MYSGMLYKVPVAGIIPVKSRGTDRTYRGTGTTADDHLGRRLGHLYLLQ